MPGRNLSVLLVGLLAILHGHCNSKSVVAQSASSTDDYDFEMAVIQKIAQNTESNFVISPYSQKILLGLIKEGAVDETAEEIQKALRLPEDWIPSLPANRVPLSTKSANRAKKSPPPDGLKIANRIFLDKEYQLKEDYRQKLQRFYSADVESVDKEQPQETADKINQWVKNETAGLIPSIVQRSDITTDFSMALSNAIHFNGTWKNSFAHRLTKEKCFYKNGKDDCAMQEMMDMNPEKKFHHGYLQELDAEVVNLPYKDREYSMVIVLPKQRNGIDRLIQNIHSYSIQNLTSDLENRKVDVKIPKFTVEYETNLVEVFKSLGINRAFGVGAQLDNMVHGDKALYVSNVLHKSRIGIDENGSEAAGASIALISKRTRPVNGNEEPIPFIADHPFLYFIKDDANNTLFAGKYIGP